MDAKTIVVLVGGQQGEWVVVFLFSLWFLKNSSPTSNLLYLFILNFVAEGTGMRNKREKKCHVFFH